MCIICNVLDCRVHWYEVHRSLHPGSSLVIGISAVCDTCQMVTRKLIREPSGPGLVSFPSAGKALPRAPWLSKLRSFPMRLEVTTVG